jgi:hypothetical protein
MFVTEALNFPDQEIHILLFCAVVHIAGSKHVVPLTLVSEIIQKAFLLISSIIFLFTCSVSSSFKPAGLKRKQTTLEQLAQ